VIPRPEHPRPQFVREDWLCLNGTWQFEADPADTGLERGLLERELSREILVPFCPESELSGVGEVDFMEAVWYRRVVGIPAEWEGRRALLHFQAVDHEATVWVNGVQVARHRGGWTPFSADLGDVARPGEEVTIVVRARDPRAGAKARGKQSDHFESYGIFYTRTTGIWQSVWLEPVPESHLLRPRITPEVGTTSFQVELAIRNPHRGLSVRARLADADGEVAAASVPLALDFGPRLTLAIDPERARLWSPQDPFLYDLELELVDGEGRVVDSARSYAGLRSVAIDGKAVLLNGEPVFQRLVLDQGYYPDGVMTAPSDEALVRDIELAKSVGFNGARLHQKVFEERFLYHCDRLGYLVWGEYGDLHVHPVGGVESGAGIVAEWLEAVERDYSHPALIGWCPLNEAEEKIEDRLTRLDELILATFLATKAADRSRPVIDVSGFAHRLPETDVYDSHNYLQDPEEFAKAMGGLAEGNPYTNDNWPLEGPCCVPYAGQPYFCSEFGGIWWNPDAGPGEESWGYGERPQSVEEFHARFEGLVRTLLGDPEMFGYCYTQLTDVEQEQNGIFRYDRAPKFDSDRLRAVQSEVAAIERTLRPDDR
jgi:beta-galactosidase/beta-glucuronidase